MSSILPGYEYDIFISYRQNDNRSDQWVTNFVNALKEELEATLKNPVSIYFDENPHDGLLETHQVDASLAKKLKCLIFIPIISQTYCDETSFAWEYEFLPFIKMAKEDELGMNINLSNGNVVSRVLPIKIHRLDIDDQSTLEAVLNGPLRSIDFIYNEAGVNRPLKPSDDRTLNLLKTDYHNQINKVANALKDIGTSIIKQSDGDIKVPVIKPASPPPGKSSKKGIYLVLAAIIVAVALYFGFRQFINTAAPAKAEDITIAVLAFDDQSPNGDQEWLGDGMADEILNVLARVKGLQVTGKTSSFSFKDKNVTIKEIGEALNVKTVLEGSVVKVGNKLRITAQLIDVETDKHIWSNKYDRDASDIFAIIDEVAQNIARALKNELSIKELEDIKIAKEVNPEAYEYFLKGEYFFNKFYAGKKIDNFRQSEKMYLQAIAIDSAYAEAYASLAGLYYQKIWTSIKTRIIYDQKVDSLVDIAYSINPNSAYVLKAKGEAFIKINNRNIDSAFYYFFKSRDLAPGNILFSYQIVGSLWGLGLYENSISLSKRLLKSDPLNLVIRKYYAWSLESIGKYKEAQEQYLKILEIDPANAPARKSLLYFALFNNNDLSEAKSIYQRLEQINPNANKHEKALILAAEGKKEEALSGLKSMHLYSILDMKKETFEIFDSLMKDVAYSSRNTYQRLQNSRVYDCIRDEPEFKEILAKAKIVHEERVAKYGHYFDD